MNEYGYIYKIVNDIDDMVYIGKTINPKERWKRHLWDCRRIKNKLYLHMCLLGVSHFRMIIYITVESNCIQERNKVLNTLESKEISKIHIDKTLNIKSVNKNKPCT